MCSSAWTVPDPVDTREVQRMVIARAVLKD